MSDDLRKWTWDKDDVETDFVPNPGGKLLVTAEEARAALASLNQAQDASKKEKAEVQFEHPAKGPNHCGECKHYDAPSKMCEIVLGSIEPEDWCNQFEMA